MIIYFGNILSKYGKTRTTIENLGPKLKNYFQISLYSSIKNPILRLLHMIFGLLTFRRSIKLILIDTYSTKAFYYSIILGFFADLFSIPYVPILHGGNLLNRFRQNPRLTTKLLNNSSINVSPSRYLITSFSFLDINMQYLPNYIDLNRYTFKKRNKPKPNLFWLRSFHEIYNPRMAILVINKLLKKYPTAFITMVGPEKDGSQKDCFELSKRLGIDEHVNFTGLLSKSDWINLSRQSDIFINTTHIDNMPVSIIEAMALGFPIVSTNVGGIQYILKNGENALLVDDNDVSGMVKNISNLIENTELASQLSRNARYASLEFGWEHIGPQWTKLINQNKIDD